MKKLLNKKGFTLMEMLIVVAIIVILVFISIPIFDSSVDSAKQATDAANLRAAKSAYVMQTMAGAGTDKIDASLDYYYDFGEGKFIASTTAADTAKNKDSLGQCANHEGDYIKIDHTNKKVVWSDSAHADKCK